MKKTIIIIGISIAIFVAAGLLFWRFYPKGILILSVSPIPDQIKIDQEVIQNVRGKNHPLTPGSHSVEISKKGHIVFRQDVLIKKGAIQTLKAELVKGSFVNSLSTQGANSAFIAGSNNSKLYAFDGRDFYLLDSTQKTYNAPNFRGEKLVIDLGLKNEEVNNVKFSPDKSKVIVFISKIDNQQGRIVWVDLGKKSITDLADVVNADWLDNDNLIIVKNKKLFSLSINGTETMITNLNGNLFYLYGVFANQAIVRSIENKKDDIVLINLSTKENKLLNLNGTVLEIKPSEQNLLVLTLNNKDRRFSIFDKTLREKSLGFTPYLNLFTWENDGQSFAFIEFASGSFILKDYDVTKNTIKTVSSWTANSLSDAPSRITIQGNQYIISAGRDLIEVSK